MCVDFSRFPCVSLISSCEHVLCVASLTSLTSLTHVGHTLQVEPYILGKYIKYSSNAGGVNLETLDDVSHVRVQPPAVSCWHAIVLARQYHV